VLPVDPLARLGQAAVSTIKELFMVRLLVRRVLALVLLSAVSLPGRAAEVYQVSTISSLLAGGYDGDISVGELLRHGNFGLGTFNGADGEMMVLDGRVYRGKTDGRAELVSKSERTPFAVVAAFRGQGPAAVTGGQSLDQLEATLDALPYSASRILAARIDGRFESIKIRSEPKQTPPYRPLTEVIKQQQVVHTLDGVRGTLIGFRFPAAASSVNVAGWHFHFLTADKRRGGHVLGLTTVAGRALLEEISDLRINFPAKAPAASASPESIRDVERPR
jgi:acetolactate decarboxylase